MKQTYDDCRHCDFGESLRHDLVWHRDRSGDWQLFVRCSSCRRRRPAAKTISRDQVPLPDLANQLVLF